MDINDNLQHMTTFTGGMDTDTSDMLLQADRYRLAKNLRLITDSTSNSGELHCVDELGNVKQSGAIPTSNSTFHFSEGEHILKTSQIRDYGIVITSTGREWSIYKLHYITSSDRIQNGLKEELIFGPCANMIGSNISMVTRWESDSVVKLYIADGKHSLMSINIMDVKNPVPTDISYLLSLKEHTLKKPEITPNVGQGGTFKPGVVQYAYTLYNKYGSESNISPLSNMYNVTGDATEGTPNTKTVSFSANIQIDETKGVYNKIKIYRILYTQIGQDPLIGLIYDDDLPSSGNVSYIDAGTEIQNISVDSFLAEDDFFLYPNEIESKNNYLYLANVKDYFTARIDIYNKLKEDINKNKFTVNTANQLNNLSFAIDYDSSAWGTPGNRPVNQDSYFGWDEIENATGRVYMNDEIYRFGIVLYDKYGVQWPVIWVMDLRTPTIGEIGCKIWLNDTQGFQSRYDDFFTGYEIVRCNRTAASSHVLSQGIAGRALQSYNYAESSYYSGMIDPYTGYTLSNKRAEEHGTANQYLTHSGFMTFTDIVVYGQHSSSRHDDNSQWQSENVHSRFFYNNDIREYSSSSNYIIFASPEACYQSDDLINMMKEFQSSLKIKTLSYVDIKDRTSQRLLTDVHNFYHYINNFLSIYSFPPVDTGIGFFPNRVAMFAYAGADTWDPVNKTGSRGFKTDWNSSSDASNYYANYLMYDKDNIIYENGVYKNRLAMWFPIFAQKWMTPEYRDYGESSEWSQSGVTYWHDSSNDTAAPILNLIEDTNIRLSPENNNSSTIGNYQGNIQKFSEITVPTYDQFVDGSNNIIFRNNSTIIEEKQLLPWSVEGYANYINLSAIHGTYSNLDSSDAGRNWYNGTHPWGRTEAFMFPVSAIGKGLVLKTDINFQYQMLDVTNYAVDSNDNIYEISADTYKNQYFWDISNQQTQRKNPSAAAYRFNYFPGTSTTFNPDGSIPSIQSKRLSIPEGYVSIPIVEITNEACVPYGGFTAYARKNSIYQSYGCYYNINDSNVDYIPGDCFYTDFEYNAAKTWYNNSVRYAPHMTTIYNVKLVSKINTTLDSGDKYSRVNDWRIQDEPAELREYIQDEPAYAYNTAYSNQNSAKFFTGVDYNEDLLGCDTRIFNSAPKENNETIDSWLKFKSSSFIDVDSRYGEITNLKLFKDTLLFNQKTATGILSTNERTVIQDTNNENILLGNGSVLQRYDYISTIFGMFKGDHACDNSDTTFYWWDRQKKDILMYNRNGFAPMKVTKNVKQYIDSKTSSSNPSVIYDNEHNELLFNVVGNKTLSYNEVVQRFVSQIDYKLSNVMYLPAKTLVVDTDADSSIYDLNSGTRPLTPYIEYIVNKVPNYNKVFDNITFGGRFFGGDKNKINNLRFEFTTPLKQKGVATGEEVTNYEYDFRMAIPRAGRALTGTFGSYEFPVTLGSGDWVTNKYGGRLRGKTMKCTMTYEGNLSNASNDFSLQYIITKYRMSWI